MYSHKIYLSLQIVQILQDLKTLEITKENEDTFGSFCNKQGLTGQPWLAFQEGFELRQICLPSAGIKVCANTQDPSLFYWTVLLLDYKSLMYSGKEFLF